MYDRDSQTLRPDEEQLRQSAVAKAERWTESQAARLDTSPEAILEAIRRGPWLPEQIEGVSSRYALDGHPPPLEGVPEWIDIRIEKQCRSRANSGPTALAMATAYQRAEDRAA